MNNLAELTTIDIDSQRISQEWEEQKSQINFIQGRWRTEIGLDKFTTFFKNLLHDCIEEIKIQPKNALIQIHEEKLIQEKFYLTFTHKDIARSTCLTIPIIYNKMEPVMFYRPDIKIPRVRFTATEDPVQVSLYSEKHPTLVNVNNPHNVKVTDKNSTRILLQLSFNERFDDIIRLNPGIWKPL